jgi:hypothetical protein
MDDKGEDEEVPELNDSGAGMEQDYVATRRLEVGDEDEVAMLNDSGTGIDEAYDDVEDDTASLRSHAYDYKYVPARNEPLSSKACDEVGLYRRFVRAPP